MVFEATETNEMLLDDLVTAIQTVQARIRDHGNALSQNEYRTRISLIDPILNALGWDVSDPALVTIEDEYSGGRADYALLDKDGKGPTAIIEAKRLGQNLSAHEYQVSRYTWGFGVPYGGLTNGDRWKFWDVGSAASQSSSEKLILDVAISVETAHKCALRFLILWRHTLTEGQLVNAGEPIVNKQTSEHLPTRAPGRDSSPQEPPFPQPPSSDWVTLYSYRPKEEDRVGAMHIWFPD